MSEAYTLAEPNRNSTPTATGPSNATGQIRPCSFYFLFMRTYMAAQAKMVHHLTD
jgi:hypothetical protein